MAQASQIALANESLTWWQNKCRTILFRFLSQFKQGYLRFEDSEGERYFGNPNATLVADIRIHSNQFYPQLFEVGASLLLKVS